MRIVPVTLVLVTATLTGCDGCIDAEVGSVTSEQQVAGDAEQHTQIDDVHVDDANVDADTEVDAEGSIDSDVETNTDVDTDIDVDIDFGGDDGDDDGDDDAADDGCGGADPDGDGAACGSADGAPDPGGATAVGDEVAFEYRYQGPWEERVDVVPGFGAVEVGSVEWIAVGVAFDGPAFFEDEAGFAWGAPQLDAVEDGDDEYLLAHRFGDEAGAPFAWTTVTTLCVAGADATTDAEGDDDAACVGRAVSAACRATVVLRAHLVDGTTREARADHESARPTCMFD